MSGLERVFNEAQQADIAAMIYVSIGKSNNVIDMPSFRPINFSDQGGPRYSQYLENRIEATSHVHEDAVSKSARGLPVRLDVSPGRVAQLLSLESLPYGRVGFQELIVTILSGTSYQVMSAFFNKNIPEFRLDCIDPANRHCDFYIRRYKHYNGQKTVHHIKAEFLGVHREPIMWEEFECSVQGQAGSLFGDTWAPWESTTRGKARAGSTPDNQRPSDLFVMMLCGHLIWDLVREGNGTIQWNEIGSFAIYK